MGRAILILEDDEARLRRFRAVLLKLCPQHIIHHWSDAHAMIRQFKAHLDAAALISLDHDLYPRDAAAADPGDGLLIARRLAELPPTCPVLIHSSNSDRARMMQGELDLGGWACQSIAPLGDNWIENDWAFVVSELLSGKQNSR